MLTISIFKNKKLLKEYNLKGRLIISLLYIYIFKVFIYIYIEKYFFLSEIF